jgi:protein translocase SecG subunit
MSTIALLFHVFIVITMIVAILIQRSEGGGFAAGNVTSSLVNARGVSDFLTRSTSLLAIIFFASSIFLALLTKSYSDKESSILESYDENFVSNSLNNSNGIDEETFDSKVLDNDSLADGSDNNFIPRIEIPVDFN